MTHVYKASNLTFAVCATSFIMMLLAAMWVVNIHYTAGWLVTILLLSVILGFLFSLAKTMLRKITLTKDAILYRDFFSTSVLPYQDIAGWELSQQYNPWAPGGYYVDMTIYSKNPNDACSVVVPGGTMIDGYFKSWILAFPNLTGNKGPFDISSVKKPARWYEFKRPERVDVPVEELTEAYFAQSGL